MLGVMATVTTGLLSPNSYGINPDQVAAKMAAQGAGGDLANYDQLRRFGQFANSSDSETELTRYPPVKQEHHHHQAAAPKRNKRKDFKPRCTNTASYSDNEENSATTAVATVSNTLEFANNNNNNSSKSRRKTTATRKVLLVDGGRYGPMDLSKNESDEASDASPPSPSSSSATDSDENGIAVDETVNSFSIHNLSRPHAAVAAATSTAGGGQVASEMREYAVNTMRELLGIYGLTSEVAESITRQLPIAAFNSGKILENIHLGTARIGQSPPSRPPTPPSTPLSPKPGETHKNSAQPPQTTNTTTSTIMPNITIVSSPQSLPHHLSAQQKTPLNLGMKKKSMASVGQALYANGGGGGVALPDYPYSQIELDALRSKNLEDRLNDQKQQQQLLNSRGIFPHIMQFGGMKSEDGSPPPMDTSPLNAMMAQSLAAAAAAAHHAGHNNPSLSKTQTQMDYSKYVKKFSSSVECGSAYCKDLNYREHFHCLDCNSRVFLKKEEMIRHFKWHKKRDESLQHGFMRYSPLDDCTDRYGNCTHNRKQTHYHCIKEGCDKVYISTSDVQMHANYHRKDSAIIQEGFQRFRATEECGASYCAFFGQRTTHFHCRRQGCRFTFKNKSDMEKHKSYHIKDEQLSRDGFKKFMKNEVCPYENCRFSKVCNHIHCIRPQCNYVLHSSGQLFSHKRKHERKDSELAYRKYKLAQSMMKTLQDGGVSVPSFPRDYEQQFEGLNLSMLNQNFGSNMSNSESMSERTSPVSYEEENSAMDLSANDSSYHDENPNWNNEEFWRKFCSFVGAQENCTDNCEYANTEHYHCLVEHCEMVINCKDGVREHARNHEQQEQVTDAYYTTISNGTCDSTCIYQDREKHYHCTWDNCREVILPTDKPFRRLEHYKMHEYSRKLSLTKDPLTMTHLATSIDGMFCRKRGRPPKNRVIEVWNDYSPLGGQSLMDSPQAIFTSFKLPKPSTVTPSSSKELDGNDSNDDRSNSPTSIQDYNLQGFDIYNENTKCPDNLCPYLGNVHFHCNQNRCLYVTDKEDVLIMHSKDFHDNIDILDGFEFYDRNVDCRLPGCPSNKVNRHFHCTRPGCSYSFVQYSTMAQHNQKHVQEEEVKIKTEPVEEKSDAPETYKAINLSQSSPDNKISVVKASGTFYPLSTIPTEPQKSPEIKAAEQPNNNDISGSNTLYGPELSCSRPFCKLKRKYHYHCNACNQAFSEVDRLVVHVAKHTTGVFNTQLQEDNNNQQPAQTPPPKPEGKINVAPLQSLQEPPKEASNHYMTPTFDAYTHFSNFPANLATQFALMSQQQFLPQGYAALPTQLMFQHSGLMQSPLLAQGPYGAENMTSPLAAMAANLNKRTLDSQHEMTPDAKKARIQNSMRILKDEPVPEGYLRFRFNEDCQYQHCGYREHQTHFHCQRQDCGYSFCDKTRFVQHTARHERLDTLMGGDFQQYRANVACGRPDCAYTANLGSTQNKASHFHCLKCEFVCTDTNKVVAHRRQHQKLDSIQAAGFEKFTPSQHCRSTTCQHSGKQTHYHCLQCQYAVLGLAQMSAHKYRHMEG